MITTTRLILRKPKPEDAAAFFKVYSHREAMRYWSTPPHSDIEETVKVIENSIRGWETKDYYDFSIQLAQGQSVIGKAALHNIHKSSRRAEVGYLLSPDYWGQGYMKEAMTALIEHAFGALEMRRLEADIDPDNAASRALLERLSFRKEGELRERWEIGGKITDSHLYGLLARDWQGP
ncbi:GNAT family N-acetyltransferase [Saccharospirillum salsuginis]|uniref:N-acetyltransferase n=1 Tax=Saccharospirillum salsuginis TaxID=418750 RepID=A0A918NDY9_9GAMM|nr:GNAT family N-acetyltransferase [Saccharospirillum salsuginis]GGX63307.1 N-acetyltransferase [Saccharospirillum salsuginis]